MEFSWIFGWVPTTTWGWVLSVGATVVILTITAWQFWKDR